MTPEEYFGGSAYDIAGNNVTLRTNQHYGFIDPTGAGQWVQLPDARHIRVGDVYKVTNRGTDPGLHSVDVRDDTGASLFTLPAAATSMFVSFSDATSAGSWTNRVTGTAVGVGAAIPFSRAGFEVEITDDAVFYNLESYLTSTTSYTGSGVVKANFFINANVFGTPGPQAGGFGTVAIDTGAFDPGSTIYVEIGHNFEIGGGGGNGGDGGDESTTTAGKSGGNGGYALKIDTQTVLRVHGRISAGAGGGGGGDYHLTDNGDGGGGGGGSPNGNGGAAGGTAANDGGDGIPNRGGVGGLQTTNSDATPGGAGGLRAQPGVDGAASGDGAGLAAAGIPHADAIQITARPGASLQILGGDGLITGNVTQL